MNKQILLILSLIFGLTTLTFAQTARTITNDDLEKYRQKREQADAEYRATYKERGMPSPEELEQREAKSQKDLAERAARARELQQQQDEINAQQQQNQLLIQNSSSQNGQNGYYNQQPYYGNGQVFYNGYYNGYGGGRFRGNRQTYYNVQPHTQLSPLLPNVRINTTPTRIFITPTRISVSSGRRGGR